MQCYKKGCYVCPFKRKKVEIREEGNFNEILALWLYYSNDHPRILDDLRRNVLVIKKMIMCMLHAFEC